MLPHCGPLACGCGKEGKIKELRNGEPALSLSAPLALSLSATLARSLSAMLCRTGPHLRSEKDIFHEGFWRSVSSRPAPGFWASAGPASASDGAALFLTEKLASSPSSSDIAARRRVSKRGVEEAQRAKEGMGTGPSAARAHPTVGGCRRGHAKNVGGSGAAVLFLAGHGSVLARHSGAMLAKLLCDQLLLTETGGEKGLSRGTDGGQEKATGIQTAPHIEVVVVHVLHVGACRRRRRQVELQRQAMG